MPTSLLSQAILLILLLNLIYIILYWNHRRKDGIYDLRKEPIADKNEAIGKNAERIATFLLCVGFYVATFCFHTNYDTGFFILFVSLAIIRPLLKLVLRIILKSKREVDQYEVIRKNVDRVGTAFILVSFLAAFFIFKFDMQRDIYFFALYGIIVLWLMDSITKKLYKKRKRTPIKPGEPTINVSPTDARRKVLLIRKHPSFIRIPAERSALAAGYFVLIGSLPA